MMMSKVEYISTERKVSHVERVYSRVCDLYAFVSSEAVMKLKLNGELFSVCVHNGEPHHSDLSVPSNIFQIFGDDPLGEALTNIENESYTEDELIDLAQEQCKNIKSIEDLRLIYDEVLSKMPYITSEEEDANNYTFADEYDWGDNVQTVPDECAVDEDGEMIGDEAGPW